MAIGRTKKFAEALVLAIERVQEQTGANNIADLAVPDVLNQWGDILFEEIATLVNFIFSYRNDSYEPIDAEWASENLRLSDLSEIIQGVAEQNGMGWLLPFFKSSLMQVVQQKAGEMSPNAFDSTSGKATTSS